MKKSIDLDATFLGMFMLNKAFKVKFPKYWGTTTVDGVPVFNKQYTYFSGRTAAYTKTTAVQRMLKVIGLKKKINDAVDDFQGIESAWFFINADKVPANQTEDLTLDLLATRIEDTYEAQKWYNSQISLDVTAYQSTLYPNDVLDKANAIEWLVTHIQAEMPRAVLSSTEQNEADEEFSPNVLSKYVLLDVDEDVFEWECTNITLTRSGTNRLGACIDYKFRRTALVVDGQISYLTQVHEYVKERLPEASALLANRLWTSDRTLYLDDSDDESSVTNDLFYKGYMRVAALDLPRSKFSALVMASLDSDYKIIKKKKKWYQKLLAIVVFVVIVWVSWGAAAPAAGLAGVAAESVMATIALAATYAAIGLALAQMVFSKLGYADLVGFYGKFVKIFGIVSLVLGVVNIVNNVITKVSASMTATKAAEAAAVEAAKEGASEAVKNEAARLAAEMAEKSLTNMVKNYVTEQWRELTLKVVQTATDMWMKNQLAPIQNATNSLQKQIAEQEEILYDMYDKEYNLPLEAITWQDEPLKKDNAQYEVDYLYEPTKMNICRRSFF